MIKIAHEAPVSFMRSVKRVTDYDYALACLFDKVPGYYDYFVEALKEGRHVLLDNGVFEDGVPMNSAEYAGWIEKLQPTEYIVPDEFDKMETTMRHFHDWVTEFGDLPGGMIGVCQGTSFSELDQCYRFLDKMGANKIAINFASVAYQNHPGVKDDTRLNWEQKAVYGRIAYLGSLVCSDFFNKERKHHILGCVLPWEFSRLKEHRILNQFDTMDTSAPVVWGLLKGLYPDDINSIQAKIKTKLKDLILTKPTPEQSSDILFNIAKFRYHLS